MDETQEFINEFSKDPEWKKGFEEEKKKLEASILVTQLRNSVGISQETLATKAGVAKSTIARIENGNMSPTFKTMNKIAKATGKKLEMWFA